jgi:TRAP-type mannitol/chloroaromatic compound transport system permease large subunit
MAWFGIALLVLVGAGIITTGLPAAVVLMAMASFGACVGIVSGVIDAATLWALPSRLINLLESDVLQALPLYVTMGLLLDRLPVADALYRASLAVLPRKPSAPLVSGMLLGALLGPMNGSVGASVLALSRVVAPRLAAEGISAPHRHAIVASTLGVLVPPSLVLILLSDAMLSAHTIAVTATGRTDRVVNTQDIFHAALVPGGIFLLLCLALSGLIGRSAASTADLKSLHHKRRIRSGTSDRQSGTRTNKFASAHDFPKFVKAGAAMEHELRKVGTRLPERAPLTAAQGLIAVAALAFLLVLLAGVALGYFYAVEAAAMGAFVLLTAGLLSGRLPKKVLGKLLGDAIALTGALFSLLLAATTFTMVLRLLGTADLAGRMVSSIPGGDVAAVAVVLGLLAVSAFVLDAFEIIFVIVPIVIPPLLIRVADARWVSVLVLLTLQSSFLLPPFGYALMMVRGVLKEQVDFRDFLRAMAPFLAAQWLLLLSVLFFPQLTHPGKPPEGDSRPTPATLSDEEFKRRLNEMIKLPEPEADASPDRR